MDNNSQKQTPDLSNKKHPKKKTLKSAKIVLEYQGFRYGMVKDRARRSCKAPLPPQDQGEDSCRIAKNPCIHVLGGERTVKQASKLIKRSSTAELSTAFKIFCSAGELFQSTTIAWHILLLSLLARVLDLAATFLPGIPIVNIKSCNDIPNALKTILHIINGPENAVGKGGWKLKRPSVLVPVSSQNYQAISAHPVDYVGGKYKDNFGDQYKFWIPPHNQVVAITNAVPASVVKTLFETWSTAIPIICNGRFKFKNRPVIELDGKELLMVDSEIDAQLITKTEILQAELICFFGSFRGKKKWWKSCLTASDTYLPKVRSGRYVHTISNPEARVFALALSVFRELLEFAECMDWIQMEEAETIFLSVWKAVFPQSAPQYTPAQAAAISDRETVRYDDPTIFYQFLTEKFLPQFHEYIALPGESVPPSMVGKLHLLDGQLHFITHRKRYLQMYHEYLKEHRATLFPMNGDTWETAVQSALMLQGIPIKKEGNSGGWRCPTFYDKEYRGAVKDHWCLGFPLAKLPETVQNAFEQQFGICIENSTHPKKAVYKPDVSEVSICI